MLCRDSWCIFFSWCGWKTSRSVSLGIQLQTVRGGFHQTHVNTVQHAGPWTPPQALTMTYWLNSVPHDQPSNEASTNTKTDTKHDRGQAGGGFVWRGFVWKISRGMKGGRVQECSTNKVPCISDPVRHHRDAQKCVFVCLSVCQCVNLGVYTYRQASPPSTSSIRGIAKQLVTMVAVFCAPISNHFTEGGVSLHSLANSSDMSGD